MISPNDNPRAADKSGAADDFRRFVEEMARFTTALDDLQDTEFRDAFAKEYGLAPEAVTDEEVLAELSDDRLYSEMMAFWKMIRKARLLVARAAS